MAFDITTVNQDTINAHVYRENKNIKYKNIIITIYKRNDDKFWKLINKMEIIEKKNYPYKEIVTGEIVENKIFKNCHFDNCMLSYIQNDDPSDASILRNCQFINCSTTEATAQTGGIIENVLVENLKISGVLFFTNVLFKNTQLKGKIGKISLNSKIPNFAQIFNKESIRHQITPIEIERFDQFRINYYKNIDLAIDISQAEFSYCEISPSIPAHLIKRNPETQVLIKYENIVTEEWKKNIRLKESILKYRFEKSMLDKMDVVFVAPTLSKKDYQEYMELIKILRQEGIAEFD